MAEDQKQSIKRASVSQVFQLVKSRDFAAFQSEEKVFSEDFTKYRITKKVMLEAISISKEFGIDKEMYADLDSLWNEFFKPVKTGARESGIKEGDRQAYKIQKSGSVVIPAAKFMYPDGSSNEKLAGKTLNAYFTKDNNTGKRQIIISLPE